MQSEIPWKTGKARVLTSAECLQALKDKERKKKKEAVQKTLHFEERSQKKNQREEELCRKKEEMARKTAEGEAAMVEKEVAKTKRRTAKLQVREKRKLQNSKESLEKRPRVNSAVFTDLCCVSFGSYREDTGTERQWLQCKCQ